MTANPSSIKYPPLLLKYLKMFQEDPSSKIFAPLSECYRKIGLVDEAIQICKEGLSQNPDFTGGKVALARAYFDKKNYQEVRSILGREIYRIPDNLIAQRMLADSCLLLGFVQESLQSYKMLLYFNPNDREVQGIVAELETSYYKESGLLKGKAARLVSSPDKFKKLIRLQKALQKIEKIKARVISY